MRDLALRRDCKDHVRVVLAVRVAAIDGQGALHAELPEHVRVGGQGDRAAEQRRQAEQDKTDAAQAVHNVCSARRHRGWA
jgi:hypothetical protein